MILIISLSIIGRNSITLRRKHVPEHPQKILQPYWLCQMYFKCEFRNSFWVLMWAGDMPAVCKFCRFLQFWGMIICPSRLCVFLCWRDKTFAKQSGTHLCTSSPLLTDVQVVFIYFGLILAGWFEGFSWRVFFRDTSEVAKSVLLYRLTYGR